MKKCINVLIFPAGEVNAIELHDALSTNVNIRVFGASSVDKHGGYIFENYISNVPLITHRSFITQFNQIIKLYNIDVIFPSHDSVALFLSTHRERISAKIVVADKKTTDICRNKQKIYEEFRDYDFNPILYGNLYDVVNFPVFAKPFNGQGGVGAKIIGTIEELRGCNFEENVVTEYLPGDEVTVDCLTDYLGDLAVVSPRTRKRVMAGISVCGEILPLTDEIYNIAYQINQRLSFLGLWFFQLKRDAANTYKLLEISTRCTGSMCLTRASGVNLPLLSVYTVLCKPIHVIKNKYTVVMDRSLISRYKINYEYSCVYLDFDDTLIVRDKVNLTMIRFIYQCRNKGIKIFLISKHLDNLEHTLNKFSIDKNLFEKVITLKRDDRKYKYVSKNNAIFIDNAYEERSDVFEKLGVPVFDVDTVEVLIDWRC